MNVGGTARYVSKLVNNIPDSLLATGRVQDSEIEDPVVNKISILRVKHLGRRLSLINDILAWVELNRIIAKTKPQILHTHTFKAGVIGRLARGQHQRIHTFHGHLFDDSTFSSFQKFVIKKIEKLLAERTDLLISVGQKVGSEIRSHNIGKDRVWVSIPPGVDSLPKIEKSKARAILGIKGESLVVGWMARMEVVKNPYLLLEVAKLIPEIDFVMAGGGSLLNTVTARAPGNVQVIGWADATNFWSSVDIAISTSENEGMPIALIEAELAGIPIIATPAGSNQEVVLNGKTGFIKEGTAVEMSEAIRALANQRELLTELGKSGRIYAEREFSTKKMIASHIESYVKLIDIP